MDTPHHDPYATCEHGRCNHDLARTVGIAELWATDGPYAFTYAVSGATPPPPALFDDEERPYEPDPVGEQQRWAV